MKKIRFKDLVVHEDADFIGINKPAGIASLHEHFGTEPSIIELAKSYSKDIQLCHRIDKETSGVLLLAKHAEAYRHASMAFEHRNVNKYYHAIASGVHAFSDLELSLPLHTTRSGKASINAAKGKMSTTVFNTLDSFGHYSLIECRPITGRLHQIRIHLASQNAAIAADDTYGGKSPMLSDLKRNFSLGKYAEEKPMIGRFALHAYSIELTDMENRPLKIVAPYPKDFAVFLKQLKKYDQPQF